MDATTWNKRIASCVGKEPFTTPQLANKVLRRRAKKPGRGRGTTRKVHHVDGQVYHCPHCGLFHIGTKAKSVHASPKRARREQHGDDAE